jgi:hypothetical protein
MGRLCARASALALLLLASCHQLHDCIDEQVTACRNTQLARYAWCRSRGNYVDCRDNLWDFGAGFRYGYADILNGSRGCAPPFPPRCYWSCCYHGDDGKCAIAAWYDGYHHGAAAALADGYTSDYGAVPSSIDLYQRCGTRPVQLDLDQYKAATAEASEAAPEVPGFHSPPTDFADPDRPELPLDPPYSPAVDTPDAPKVAPPPQAFMNKPEAGSPVRLSQRIVEAN